MDGFLNRLFAGCSYTLRDMHVVVPHQASHLGMQHLRKRLGVPEASVVDIYAQHGNQVAASIPTALHEAI
ncbi:3-oxoacyl-[acyl-carrier-protein] synthase III C-terminal domain-containing protein, partial [Acinetobacter baumannii]